VIRIFRLSIEKTPLHKKPGINVGKRWSSLAKGFLLTNTSAQDNVNPDNNSFYCQHHRRGLYRVRGG
jgi:hypothetical protein